MSEPLTSLTMPSCCCVLYRPGPCTRARVPRSGAPGSLRRRLGWRSGRPDGTVWVGDEGQRHQCRLLSSLRWVRPPCGLRQVQHETDCVPAAVPGRRTLVERPVFARSDVVAGEGRRLLACTELGFLQEDQMGALSSQPGSELGES